MYEIKFVKDPLAVEQNNCLTKIVNVYIVCEFDVWPRNATDNFRFKNFIFGATNLVKIVIKKSMYIEDME